MTIATFDTPTRTHGLQAAACLIDKDNVFALDELYGITQAREPQRYHLDQHTAAYDWTEQHAVWLALGEFDVLWLDGVVTR